jgi:hypothetical protein
MIVVTHMVPFPPCNTSKLVFFISRQLDVIHFLEIEHRYGNAEEPYIILPSDVRQVVN